MFTVNLDSDKQNVRKNITNMLLRGFQKCQQIPYSTALFAKKRAVFLRTIALAFVSFGQIQFPVRFYLGCSLGELSNRVLSTLR